MVPIILAAILSIEPLDCGEALTLTNDTLVTLGYAETEEGEFYFGFDFTSETSYCSPTAPSTEISLGENILKFKKVESLPHDSMSSCTYVFGRDFFLAHKVDFDRNYRSISISEDDLESATGSATINSNSGNLVVEMNGTSDISGEIPLGVLRHFGRIDQVPGNWKTVPNVLNFALTSEKWPVWYATGGFPRFGLALIPGRIVRFDLAKKRLEWSAGKDDENELILGEYAGVSEVFQIEGVNLGFYVYDEESEADEVLFQDVVTLGGTASIDLLSLLRTDPFSAIAKLRRAESLVYVDKSGTQKTASLDVDPET
jgi:hypothetical protein